MLATSAFPASEYGRNIFRDTIALVYFHSQGIIEGLITRSTLVNTLSRQFIQEKKEA